MKRAAAALALLAVSTTACGSAESSGEQAVANVARITCGKDSLEVTPVVRARQDGVHLFIEAGTDRTVSVLDSRGAGFGGGGGAIAQTIPPGSYEVVCEEVDGSMVRQKPLKVVDHEHHWTSTKLDCNQIMSMTVDYVAGPSELPEDPVVVTRRTLADRLKPGDVVETAGYPKGKPRETRVVRGERVVAKIQFTHEGMRPSTTDTCSDF